MTAQSIEPQFEHGIDKLILRCQHAKSLPSKGVGALSGRKKLPAAERLLHVAKRDSALPDRPHVPSGRNNHVTRTPAVVQIRHRARRTAGHRPGRPHRHRHGRRCRCPRPTRRGRHPRSRLPAGPTGPGPGRTGRGHVPRRAARPVRPAHRPRRHTPPHRRGRVHEDGGQARRLHARRGRPPRRRRRPGVRHQPVRLPLLLARAEHPARRRPHHRLRRRLRAVEGAFPFVPQGAEASSR
ncbi:hypothetical protein SMICM304S_04734 [Streptomyces microflavus]